MLLHDRSPDDVSDRAHVVVVDDHDRYRDGLVRYLRRSGAADDVTPVAAGPEAIEVITRTRPHVALVDLGGGPFGAVEIWRRVRDVDPDLAGRIVGLALDPGGPSSVEFRELTGGEVLDKALSRPELSRAVERRALAHRRAE